MGLVQLVQHSPTLTGVLVIILMFVVFGYIDTLSTPGDPYQD